MKNIKFLWHNTALEWVALISCNRILDSRCKANPNCHWLFCLAVYWWFTLDGSFTQSMTHEEGSLDILHLFDIFNSVHVSRMQLVQAELKLHFRCHMIASFSNLFSFVAQIPPCWEWNIERHDDKLQLYFQNTACQIKTFFMCIIIVIITFLYSTFNNTIITFCV